MRPPTAAMETPAAARLEQPVAAPAARIDVAPAAQAEPSPSSAAVSRELIAEAIFHALANAGIEYRWGGNSRASGFDCSGLVVHVYREAFGVILPHNTRAQSERTTPVAPGDLRPGDLLFYNTRSKPYSHVGIFLGEGKFIHAPKAGSAVRVENMRAGYWSKRFDGARRVSLAATEQPPRGSAPPGAR